MRKKFIIRDCKFCKNKTGPNKEDDNRHGNYYTIAYNSYIIHTFAMYSFY